MDTDKIVLRPASAAEMAQLGQLTSYVYGGAFGDGPGNLPATVNRPEWTLCAFAGPTLVSSYAAVPFTFRLNGAAVKMAGVTVVGTLPEYRRQGLVRRITSQSFQDMRERGQSVAALWASQAAIYQRYQYAAASRLRTYQVDTVDVNFANGDSGSCRVSRADPLQGIEDCKTVYRSFIEPRTGYLHRGSALWRNSILQEVEADGPTQLALSHDGDGKCNGYVVYSLRANRVQHRSRAQEIAVRDLAWLDLDAYRSIWRFLASHDLVGSIRWENAPTDDPATHIFAEPRMLHTLDKEGIWLRVVDAATALEARGYHVVEDLVLEILPDTLAPWNDGTYLLEVGPDGARLSPSKRTPALRVTAQALAALYTGYQSAQRLANWNLLEGDAAAVQQANRLFATLYAPHCPDHF